jgi:predicted nicotinamide N-methyase
MSHYLWNSSLVLAEYIQEGKFQVANKNGKAAVITDPKKEKKEKQNHHHHHHHPKTIKSLSHTPISCLIVLELGSGAGLPGILAAKLGATLVCIAFKFLDLPLRNIETCAKKNCSSPRLVNNNQLRLYGRSV